MTQRKLLAFLWDNSCPYCLLEGDTVHYLYLKQGAIQCNSIWFNAVFQYSFAYSMHSMPRSYTSTLIILSQCLLSSHLEIEKYFLFYNVKYFGNQSQLQVFFVVILYMQMKGLQRHHTFQLKGMYTYI